MTDILHRLYDKGRVPKPLAREAAKEIMRLRMERDDMRSLLCEIGELYVMSSSKDMYVLAIRPETCERLRATLTKLRGQQ